MARRVCLSLTCAAQATFIIALLLPGPASAATGYEGTGRTGRTGTVLTPQFAVDGDYVDVEPYQEASASAYCPPGSVVTGGGGSGPNIVYLTDSYRTPSPSPNGWRVWAYNPGASVRTVRARATCISTLTATPSEIIGPAVTINPGSYGRARVDCPSASFVTGSGGSGPGVTYLTSIHPIELSDHGASEAWAYNPGTTPRTFTARALCVSGAAFQRLPTITENLSDLAPGGYTSSSIDCPTGTTPTGGGGVVLSRSTGNRRAYITDSYPTDAGWTVWAYNPDTTQYAIIVEAICAS